MKLADRLISEPVGRRILQPDQIDDLGQAVLTLTRELWIVTDRLRILEAVLETKGLSVHDEIERFVVPPALQAELDQTRQRQLQSVLTALSPG